MRRAAPCGLLQIILLVAQPLLHRAQLGQGGRAELGAVGEAEEDQAPFAVQHRLIDGADNLQIVFVSIDPERDTPQALKDYLSSDGFPKGTIGLTGTPEQVATAAKAYRAFYQKVGEGEGYTMNHSLTVYLMGPDGKFRTAVAYGMGPDKTTRIIEQAMARG